MAFSIYSNILSLDVTFHIYSFLFYNDSIFLQKSSKYLKSHQNKMDKYCQHAQPHGIIETYYIFTKKKKDKKNYKEGKLEGIQKFWYDNGQLYYENNYKNGKLNGIQKFWYDNGQLYYEENYKNGKKEGIQKGWYDNGQLLYENNYKEGKAEGKQKRWYNNGILTFEQNYENGNMKGIQKIWDFNGKITYEDIYTEKYNQYLATWWSTC